VRTKLTWFFAGVLSTVIALNIYTWSTNRPSNAVSEFKPEVQNFMLKMMPWLESAKGVQVGPYVFVAPSESSSSPEAIVYPAISGYPQLLITKNEISFVDSQNKILSVSMSLDTGEFNSYNFSPDMISGVSYFDTDINGQFDVRVYSGKDQNKSRFQVYYDSAWHPVTTEGKKHFVKSGDNSKEIEFGKGFVWKFSN